MKHKDTEETPQESTAPVITPEWVLAEKYKEFTGVTREAVKMRRKTGAWLDGLRTKVVLRRIYVNIRAVYKWISEQESHCVGSRMIAHVLDE